MFWVGLALGVLVAAALATPLPLLAFTLGKRRSAGREALLALVAAATALSWCAWVGAHFVLREDAPPTQQSQFDGLDTLVAIGFVSAGHLIAGAVVCAVGIRRLRAA